MDIIYVKISHCCFRLTHHSLVLCHQLIYTLTTHIRKQLLLSWLLLTQLVLMAYFTCLTPSGVAVIRNFQQRGFHPHEESEDGNPIYEHCSHVFMNHNLNCDVLDLR